MSYRSVQTALVEAVSPEPQWTAELAGTPTLDRAAMEALRTGCCVAVLDSATGGVLLVAGAREISAETVNTFTRIAKGLVMLALTEARAQHLGLDLQPQRHAGACTPAFTVSIEAADGVGTGISAADRAHTLRVASAGDGGPGDLISLGHVFHVIAASGWREVPWEAAGTALNVVFRATGEECAVFSKVLADDGEVLSGGRLARFCREHGLAMVPAIELLQAK